MIDFSFWFRIFGRGVSINTGPAPFSVRHGLAPAVRLFGVTFRYLPKERYK